VYKIGKIYCLEKLEIGKIGQRKIIITITVKNKPIRMTKKIDK
jgi:hypothetical protein